MTDDLMTGETLDYDETTDGAPESPDAEGVPSDGASAEPEIPDEESEPVGDGEEDNKPGREAAKYRRRLRETEAERDQLANQLNEARRSMIDSIATAPDGGRLQSSDVLWMAGHNVSDMLDDDGLINRGKVSEVCDTVAMRLGLSRTPLPGPRVPGEGSNVRPTQQRMEDVITGSHRG